MFKLDFRTLLLGLAFGAFFTLAMGSGSGSADADRFGIAVTGSALVATNSGELFVVNTDTGMATQILVNQVNARPSDTRQRNARPFNLKAVNQVPKPDSSH